MAAIEDFWDTIDRVYGAYLDATAGFLALGEKIGHGQAQASVALGLSREQLDSLPFIHGSGDPNVAGSVARHRTTQGQLVRRNRQNGENALFLGAMSIVSIYQFWEDHFRSEIAAELTMPRQDLTNDLLGDIRLIRIAIVHHGGVAKSEIERCRLLTWFKSGDAVTIDEDKMHDLVARLRTVCDEWLAQRAAIGST
jgi:hypothetical protein